MEAAVDAVKDMKLPNPALTDAKVALSHDPLEISLEERPRKAP